MKKYLCIITLLALCVNGMAQEKLFNEAINRGRAQGKFYEVNNEKGKYFSLEKMKEFALKQNYLIGDASERFITRFGDIAKTVDRFEFLPINEYPILVYEKQKNVNDPDYAKMTSLPNGSCFIFDEGKFLRCDNVFWTGEVDAGLLSGKGHGFFMSPNESGSSDGKLFFIDGSFQKGFPLGDCTFRKCNYTFNEMNNVNSNIFVGELDGRYARFKIGNETYGIVDANGAIQETVSNEVDWLIKGVKYDVTEAKTEFDKLEARALAGDSLAQDVIIIAKGDGVYKKDFPRNWYGHKEHIKEMKQAAERGNVEAMLTYAIECDYKHNDSERIKWYEAAKAKGSELAAERLAQIQEAKEQMAREIEELRAQERAAMLERKRNCEGKQIVWTETETLDFGSGSLGEGLLDMFGGGVLHKVSYTIQYTAIVESVIADESVKCIIKRAEILDPSFASSNYLKYRKYAQASIVENVGKTRVLDMDEFELK